MSESVSKSAKRPSSRPATGSASGVSAAKNRKLNGEAATAKPLAKRSGAEKAPVQKAAKGKNAVGVATKSAKKSSRAAATAQSKQTVSAKSGNAKPPAIVKSKTSGKVSARPNNISPPKPADRNAPAANAVTRKQAAKSTSGAALTHPQQPASPPRQPTLDEAAALRAFERAHKEFVRGRFAESRLLFRALIEQHSGVAEVTARSRTYLAIAEARMRTESALPRSAEELYDRGVIELNRGHFVAAQEMFERALKRDSEGAHIHYGLAATRARLGALEPALHALGRALELQPTLRVRAQHDPDLAALRNNSEYEQLIFPSRH